MVTEAYRDVCFSTCFGNDRSCDCTAWFPGQSTPENPKGHLICDACKHHCSMHKLLSSNGSQVASRTANYPNVEPLFMPASSSSGNSSNSSLLPTNSSNHGLPSVRPATNATNDTGSSFISTLRTLMDNSPANPAFAVQSRRSTGGKVSRNRSQYFLKATVIVMESNITASLVRAESNTWTRMHQAGLIDDLELGGYDPEDWTEQAMLTAIEVKFPVLHQTGVKFYKSRGSRGLIEAPRPTKGWTFFQIKELLTGSGMKKRLYIGPCQLAIKVEKDGTVSVIHPIPPLDRPEVNGGENTVADHPDVPSTSAGGYHVNFPDDVQIGDTAVSFGRHHHQHPGNIPLRTQESIPEPFSSCSTTRRPPVLPGWINTVHLSNRASSASENGRTERVAQVTQRIRENSHTTSSETDDSIQVQGLPPPDDEMPAGNRPEAANSSAAVGEIAVIDLDTSDDDDESYVHSIAIPRRSTRLATERYGRPDGANHGSASTDGMLQEIVGSFVDEFRDPSPATQPVLVLDVIANAFDRILYFLRTSTVPLSVRPRARYQNGQDAGGVLPDIITAAWEQAFDYRTEMIPLFEGHPLKVITAQPVEEWLLVALGKLFHLCAVHNLPWPNFVDDSLFQYMLNEPVDPNRIRGVDNTVSEIVDMVAATDGDSNFPARIEKLAEYLVENNINPSQWNSLPKAVIVSKLVDLELYVRRRGNILLIKEGFNQSNFVKGIKDQSMLANLLTLLHRTVECPEEMLDQMDAVQGRTAAERVTLKHFQQYVREADTTKLRSLLIFITGSPRIPLKRKFLILFQRPGFRPAAATCGPLLKLGTHYRDSLTGYSTFHAELTDSVNSCQHAFHNA